MKDRVRLARIVLVKQRERDQRRAEMARAAERLRAAEMEVARLAAASQRLSREMSRVGLVTAQHLVSRATILEQTRTAIDAANERVAAHLSEHARTAAKVAQSSRDLAALDRISEKLRRENNRREGQREQQLLDDVSRRLG